MEPFDGYQQLADSLDYNPAMIVSELRARVQEDLATNSAAWILIGQALVKLGFQEQGEESILYGEGLKQESEYSDPTMVDDALGISNADTVQSASQHNDLVEEPETFSTITFEDFSETNEHTLDPISSDTEFQELTSTTTLREETVVLETSEDSTTSIENDGDDLSDYLDTQNSDKKGDFSEDTDAILLMSTGKYEQAMEAWTKLIKINETSGRWNGLAECLDALGYSNRANKARIRASSTRDARETAAKVDLESLAESVRSNTTYSPSRVETVNEGIEWYNKGISLLRDGKPLEALGCFEKTLYTKAEDTVELRISAKIGIADSYSALDRHEEAIRAYVQIFETNPNSLGYAAVYNMGNSYIHLGRYEDAIACLNRSLEMNQEKNHKKSVKNMIKQVKALKKASKR